MWGSNPIFLFFREQRVFFGRDLLLRGSWDKKEDPKKEGFFQFYLSWDGFCSFIFLGRQKDPIKIFKEALYLRKRGNWLLKFLGFMFCTRGGSQGLFSIFNQLKRFLGQFGHNFFFVIEPLRINVVKPQIPGNFFRKRKKSLFFLSPPNPPKGYIWFLLGNFGGAPKKKTLLGMLVFYLAWGPI